MLNCDFYLGWVLPTKSPIPKNLSEQLHRVLSRRCCQVSKLTLRDTTSLCTPGKLASMALLMGALGAGICRLRPPTGPVTWQRQLLGTGSAPGAGDRYSKNLREHSQPPVRAGNLKISL